MDHLRVEDRGKERWILLDGDLDQQEVLDLKGAFDDAVEHARGDVVLDLSGVTFISTLGIGLSFVGPAFSEARLLAVAFAYEQQTR